MDERIRKQMKKGYAVITGASAGLGEEFAFQLAKEHFSLILAARRTKRLEEIKSQLLKMYQDIEVILFSVDLTEREGLDSFEQFLGQYPVSVIINNAGCGSVGDYSSISEKEAENMDALNVMAFHRITRMALHLFEKSGKGMLLNVASSAGLFPAGPYMSQYYATKAYASSLTLGIAREYKEAGSRIYIGCLCPGPVNTEFNDKAGARHSLKGISAEECVTYTIRQMKRRRTLIIPTFTMRLAIWAGRVLPICIIIPITGHQQRKKM